MDETRCLFCWDRSLRIFPQAAGEARSGRRLVICEDCERCYWEDTGEEVACLAHLCETRIIHPERCDPDIRTFRPEHSFSPRLKFLEFNHLCSECPHRKVRDWHASSRSLGQGQDSC